MIRSVGLVPVSAESCKRVTVVDKPVAVASTVKLLVLTVDKLPAASTVYNL